MGKAQQEADRRTGELLVSPLGQAGKAEVDDLLARGEAISAVRRVRELTGLRLIDAKRLVESLRPRPAYRSRRLERVLDHLGFRSGMAASRPWWQTTKTARQGFIFGAVWAVLGVGDLLEALTGQSSGWHWATSMGMLALAGAYLVSAVALRRQFKLSSSVIMRISAHSANGAGAGQAC